MSKKVEKKIGKLLGAAWRPQKERLDADIIFPLFIVDILEGRPLEIHYLDKESQKNVDGLFVPRKPLSKNAKRAGWQGFSYDLDKVQTRIRTLWKTDRQCSH